MGRRTHRRNLVVWSQSGNVSVTSPARRPARARRTCRLIRIGILLSLLLLVRGVRPRWRPLLAGTAFTVVGVVLRGSTAGSLVLLPGFMLLLTAPLIPGTPKADCIRRSEPERELAAYVTQAQRFDLQATLDQYPDDVTHELRDILAGQATADRDGLLRFLHGT
jgi:hypothetical protein